MPTIREEMAADIAAAIALYGQTFAWSSLSDLPCVRRDTPTTLEIQEMGGEIENLRFWITVAKSVFPGGVFPQIGDGIDSNAHQVKTINGHKDPAAAQLVLGLGSFDE